MPKPTEGMTLIPEDNDGSYACGRCGDPGIYTTRGSAVRCLHCALTPPAYHAGYQWQGRERRSGICDVRITPGGWVCNVSRGHDGLHEAWGTTGVPICAWADGDTIAVFDYTRGWTDPPPQWQGGPYRRNSLAAQRRCGAQTSRRTETGRTMLCSCSLPPGHRGWHEAWRTADTYGHRTDPVMAWSPLTDRDYWHSETTT